jgi:hypothetical protein
MREQQFELADLHGQLTAAFDHRAGQSRPERVLWIYGLGCGRSFRCAIVMT